MRTFSVIVGHSHRAAHFFTRQLSVIVGITLLAAQGVALATEQILVGDAYDSKTEQFLYSEFHQTRFEDGRYVMRTEYRDAEDRLIASRLVQYDDDRVAQFVLEQPTIDYRESVVRQPQNLLFSGSEQARERQKTVDLENAADVVIDAGFSNFIVRNWDRLLAGETLKFDFASTARMDLVRLQVKKVDQQEQTGDSMVLFAMTAANPVFKMLMKPIMIGYSEQTRQLAYYRGISNIQDDRSKNYNVEIRFRKNPDIQLSAADQKDPAAPHL